MSLRLPRVQAFEFNDSASSPAALRETLVESLSRSLKWGRIVRGMVEPFREFVDRTGASELLDLCAGAAGPAEILVEEMVTAGAKPPRFILTDLFPRPEAWKAARAKQPSYLDFEPAPVDATAIPASLAAGRPRLVMNAFHHFPPALASAIVADAVRGGEGLFISESFARDPLQFANFAFAGLPALYLNPLLSTERRLQKALLTWATPLAIATATWDGIVSTLRSYEEDELREMAAAAGGDWEWTYREYHYPPAGTGYCFFGAPRRK